MRWKCALPVAGLVALMAVAALAQGRRFRDDPVRLRLPPNARYDGQFTFVRLKYTTAPGGYWYEGLPAWAHGYPLSDRNLMRILNEVSYLGARVDTINILSLDDPELFKYPVAYIIEAGWWTMTDDEVTAFRTYMQKGGFVILDDFKVRGWNGGLGGAGWENFEAIMKRVLPDARFVDLDLSHPIFHSFFEITSLDNFPQAYNSGRAIFRGLFEDNDPRKRLLMMVNYNTDVSQFWEWSARGFKPIDETNEAYKLGVNYVLYGMTH